MSHTVRFLASVAVAATIAGCSGGSAGGAVGADPARDANGLATDPAGRACATHASLDACLADTQDRCYWGPNYAWPVQVDGDPCEPAEGMCQSELSTPFTPACTVDPIDEAACQTYATSTACLADVMHRCFWTPQMGIPCSPDGWCPPPPHCETTPLRAPHCASSGPTISTPVYADCGCLNPPGGVCLQPAGDVPVPACVERPACDGTDVCACLTGLGACTPGELPNVCVCTGG